MPVSRKAARYDGLADWYDNQLDGAPHRHQMLRRHLSAGHGACLDIGCGTGRDLPIIAELGWTPIGLEVSTDQLRLAAGRGSHLVQGDAERLPFRDESLLMAISCWTSTDVDHFDRMLTEIARVLQPDGAFLFYGVHPCFNGPHIENSPDHSRIVHPSYRAAERHSTSPWWGDDGIRVKAGGMRHLPLADFINAFVDAGLRIERVYEPDEAPVPYAIVVKARKQTSSALCHRASLLR